MGQIERAQTGHQLDVALLFEIANEVVATSLDLFVGGEVVLALHLQMGQKDKNQP